MGSLIFIDTTPAALLLLGFALFIVMYYAIYRRRPSFRVVALLLLCDYLFFLLNVTILSRTPGAGIVSPIELNLLASIKRAVNTSSSILALNEVFGIVFNIVLFAPLGLLLPIVSRKHLSVYMVMFVGFLSSFVIESAQLILARGVFSLEDMMYNTLGSLVGFITYKIITANKNFFKNLFTKKA